MTTCRVTGRLINASLPKLMSNVILSTVSFKIIYILGKDIICIII